MPSDDDMDRAATALAALCTEHGLDPFFLATTPEASGLVDWFTRGGLTAAEFVARAKALDTRLGAA